MSALSDAQLTALVLADDERHGGGAKIIVIEADHEGDQ